MAIKEAGSRADIPDRIPFVIGIDPGDKTGIAVVGMNGEIYFAANMQEQELLQFLMAMNARHNLIHQIVMEDYILYKGRAKQQTGSKFKAVQVIGSVKLFAAQNKIRIKMQPANILSIAEKWSKVVPVGLHDDTHWFDAFNHAYYWLQKNGHITPKSSVREGK